MTQFQRMCEAKQGKDKEEIQRSPPHQEKPMWLSRTRCINHHLVYTAQTTLLGPLHRTTSQGHCTDCSCKNDASGSNVPFRGDPSTAGLSCVAEVRSGIQRGDSYSLSPDSSPRTQKTLKCFTLC